MRHRQAPRPRRRLSPAEQALEHLTNSKISVVITETLLPDGSWKDLLAFIWRIEASSDLVVTSKLADESLWAEVLNLGVTTSSPSRSTERK